MNHTLINCHIRKKTSNINTLMTKVIVSLNTIVIIHVNTEVLHIEYMI